MRRSMFTAVFAFLLIGSLAGCSTMSHYPDNAVENSTASYRSSMQNNGMHPSNIDPNWHDRKTTAGDPYYQGSQNQSLNSPNGNTLSRDIQNTGEKVISGTENAARDAKNGLQNAGRDVTNGVREAGRDIENGTQNVERSAKNAMEKR